MAAIVPSSSGAGFFDANFIHSSKSYGTSTSQIRNLLRLREFSARLLLRPGSRSHMACSLLFVHLSLKPRTGHLLEVQCRISMDLVVRRKFLTKFCSPDQ
jgi:hypothetical protein